MCPPPKWCGSFEDTVKVWSCRLLGNNDWEGTARGQSSFCKDSTIPSDRLSAKMFQRTCSTNQMGIEGKRWTNLLPLSCCAIQPDIRVAQSWRSRDSKIQLGKSLERTCQSTGSTSQEDMNCMFWPSLHPQRCCNILLCTALELSSLAMDNKFLPGIGSERPSQGRDNRILGDTRRTQNWS